MTIPPYSIGMNLKNIEAFNIVNITDEPWYPNSAFI